MSIVNIEGKDKAEILVALYNNTKALGMGHLHDLGRGMTIGEAKDILKERESFSDEVGGRFYFDYVHGKPLKVDLSGDTVDLRLYDRDAGEGAGVRALAFVGD